MTDDIREIREVLKLLREIGYIEIEEVLKIDQCLSALDRLEAQIAAPGQGEERDIDDACMWYRHDFELLPEGIKESIRITAREWQCALAKAKPAAPAPEPPKDTLDVDTIRAEKVAALYAQTKAMREALEWIADGYDDNFTIVKLVDMAYEMASTARSTLAALPKEELCR